MCAQIAFRESDCCNKVFQTLELERCELKMPPHYLHHLLVLRTVGIDILQTYLVCEIVRAFHIPDDPSCVKVVCAAGG